VHQYEGATGVKIGYTKLSGRTLVASAQRDGKELIAVVLNAPNWFEDAYRMLDYGFNCN
jgi:D-alanyl-D-alanine carboxypeptidase (penicillin-binding protein 5/6)